MKQFGGAWCLALPRHFQRILTADDADDADKTRNVGLRICVICEIRGSFSESFAGVLGGPAEKGRRMSPEAQGIRKRPINLFLLLSASLAGVALI